jgi:cyclic pyranopterin phosphate synthase
MHDRRRYWIGGGPDDDEGGMVEIVDPVGNAEFCANCHRVRVTHEGYLKGCLNRNDDLRSMGEMTKPEIRETFRETVAERVPYYGEYMIEGEDGEWTINEEYIGV